MKHQLAALSIAAGLALAASADANAADWNNGAGGIRDYGMGGVPVPVPRPVPEAFSYYLRADIGYGRPAKKGSLSESGSVYGDANGPLGIPAAAPFGSSGFLSRAAIGGYDDVFLGTIGGGAYVSPRWRTDVTLDFRKRSTFGQLGTYDYADTVTAGNNVRGTAFEQLEVKTTTLMLNAYYDLMQRGTFTPYVGAGVGVAFLKMERQSDVGEYSYDPATCTPATGVGCPAATTASSTSSRSQLGLAAAAMVGFSYAFDHSKALDVNYRLQYIQGGEASGTVHGEGSKLKADDLWEHQIRAGLRWNIW
jgi:opacity protein-like surface antigen